MDEQFVGESMRAAQAAQGLCAQSVVSQAQQRARDWAHARERLDVARVQLAEAERALEEAKIAEVTAWEDLEEAANRAATKTSAPMNQYNPLVVNGGLRVR